MEYGLVIGVIVFLGVMAFYGYVRGFLKIVLSLVAMVVTIFLATVLTVPVVNIVKDNTDVYENLHDSIFEVVKSYNIEEVENIKDMNLPESILDKISEGADSKIETLQNYVTDSVTDVVFKAGIFLLLTIVIYIIMMVIIQIVNLFAKLPVINGVNKSAGAVVGLAQGMFIIWILCIVLTVFSDQKWSMDILEQVKENPVLNFIYNNNLINKILEMIM